jgi:MYXO-CTERM domain-containing protein
MKSLLSARPVLWFLFLFNLVVAVAAGVGGGHLHIHGHSLHGSQQIVTAAVMGAIALGAGAALVRRRPQRA